jgi:hypothetical protein
MSGWLVAAQRLLGKSSAAFSHALINISGDLWCESTPKDGVRLSTTREIFLTPAHRPKRAVVLRPRPPEHLHINHDQLAQKLPVGHEALEAFGQVEFDIEVGRSWITAALHYVGQRYNFMFLMPKWLGDSRKFCSEFVVAVLADRGVAPFNRSSASSHVPADLQLAALGNSSAWDCFEAEFQEYLDQYKEPEHGFSPDDLRKLLKDALLAGTDAAIVKCIARAQDVEISLACLSLVPEEHAMSTLKIRLKEARETLNEAQYGKGIQRGAPWMGGREMNQRFKKAIARLKAACKRAEQCLLSKPHTN